MTRRRPRRPRCRCPLVRRGKVRDVYAVDDDRLLLVATRPRERVRRRDGERDPVQGRRAHAAHGVVAAPARRSSVPHHLLTADADEIVARGAGARAARDALAGRAMLCVRTEVVSGRVRGARLPHRLGVEGVPRVGHARRRAAAGRAAGERPLRSAASSPPRPRRRRATTRTSRVAQVRRAARRRDRRRRSSGSPARSTASGATSPRRAGIIIADTKFEFGRARRTHPADRRGADAGQLALLARRPVRAGPRAAELRQAAAARLAGRRAARRPLERRRARAHAAARGRRGDEPPLS